MTKPHFIVLEGIDGAGKSSHVPTIVKTVETLGGETIHTREPGGTPLGETFRQILLHDGMDPVTETLLMFAGRKEHVKKVIEPALLEGKNVVSDRFTDASYAYQGGGKGVSKDFILRLEQEIQGDLRPDLVLYFDVPIEVSRQRIDANRDSKDKFEKEGDEFFNNVRNAYLERAAANPGRYVVIDSTQPIEKVSEDVKRALLAHFNSAPKPTSRKP